MRDTEFYRQVLGLSEPWFVEKVDLQVSGGRVDIWVAHETGIRWACPVCSQELPLYDHSDERAWRHLDTCQFKTYVHGRVPRVECPEHGVLQVKVPWAEARSRFTLLFERFAIEVTQETATVLGACRVLRLSWDECWHLMERAVDRGRARKQETVIPVLSVDEHSYRKGHDYMTLVYDFVESTVEHVEEGRSRESLAAYWRTRSAEQLAGIEAISMDMWEPYVLATLAEVPDAGKKIVFDRFHIMRHMTHAVDLVRRAESKELRLEGDDRLKGTRYLWLFNEDNLNPAQQALFESLKNATLKVARAWAIKEQLRALWSYRSVGWARKFFEDWYAWAIRSKLEPVRNVARMIKSRLENVLTYCTLPITSSVAEAINGRIAAIKRRACGYRNRENFKTAIYFFCGGLDLYPR
jgi:transposase